MTFEWLTGDGAPQLAELTAALSEGYCPLCKAKLTQMVPFDQEDHPEVLEKLDGQYARGGCSTCRHWLRAGHGGNDGEHDWFVASMIHPRGDMAGALITLSLNPLPDPDDEYEDEPDWDWGDDDDG